MEQFLAETADYLSHYFHTHERDKHPQAMSLMNGNSGLALFFCLLLSPHSKRGTSDYRAGYIRALL